MTRLGFGKLGRRSKNLDDRLNAGTWTRFFTENLDMGLFPTSNESTCLNISKVRLGEVRLGCQIIKDTSLPISYSNKNL